MPHDVHELAAAAEYLPSAHEAQSFAEVDAVVPTNLPAPQDVQLIEAEDAA